MRKALFTALLCTAVGAGIIISQYIPKAPAPAATPNAQCTVQNRGVDLVCLVDGEPIIARIYK